MAGYNDTKAMIISTLMGRPAGTEIQPENQQAYELNMLDYIRSLELISSSPIIGVAEETTTPVQPDNARVSYISGVAQNRTVTFQNFIGENGQSLSITTGDMESYLVILLWNAQYWTMQAIPSSIVSSAENANFYYSYNIRKTYASISAMNADSVNPIGTDGKPIKIGDLVSVVNTSNTDENGFYSRIEDGWRFQSGFNFSVVEGLGKSVNDVMSQFSTTKNFLLDRNIILVEGKSITDKEMSVLSRIKLLRIETKNPNLYDLKFHISSVIKNSPDYGTRFGLSTNNGINFWCNYENSFDGNIHKYSMNINGYEYIMYFQVDGSDLQDGVLISINPFENAKFIIEDKGITNVEPDIEAVVEAAVEAADINAKKLINLYADWFDYQNSIGINTTIETLFKNLGTLIFDRFVGLNLGIFSFVKGSATYGNRIGFAWLKEGVWTRGSILKNVDFSKTFEYTIDGNIYKIFIDVTNVPDRDLSYISDGGTAEVKIKINNRYSLQTDIEALQTDIEVLQTDIEALQTDIYGSGGLPILKYPNLDYSTKEKKIISSIKDIGFYNVPESIKNDDIIVRAFNAQSTTGSGTYGQQIYFANKRIYEETSNWATASILIAPPIICDYQEHEFDVTVSSGEMKGMRIRVSVDYSVFTGQEFAYSTNINNKIAFNLNKTWTESINKRISDIENEVEDLKLDKSTGGIPMKQRNIVWMGSSNVWGDGFLYDSYLKAPMEWLFKSTGKFNGASDVIASNGVFVENVGKFFEDNAIKITGVGSTIKFKHKGSELNICQVVERTSEYALIGLYDGETKVAEFTNHNDTIGSDSKTFTGNGTQTKFNLDRCFTYGHSLTVNGIIKTIALNTSGYGASFPEGVDCLVIRAMNSDGDKVIHSLWFKEAPANEANIQVSYNYGETICFVKSTVGETTDGENESTYGDGNISYDPVNPATIGSGLDFRCINEKAFFKFWFNDDSEREITLKIEGGSSNPYFCFNFSSTVYHNVMNAGIGGYTASTFNDISNRPLTSWPNIANYFSPDFVTIGLTGNDDWLNYPRKINRIVNMSISELREFPSLEIGKIEYKTDSDTYDVTVNAGLITEITSRSLKSTSIVGSSVVVGDFARIGTYTGDLRQVQTRRIETVNLETGEITWAEPLHLNEYLCMDSLQDLVGQEVSIRSIEQYMTNMKELITNILKISPKCKICLFNVYYVAMWARDCAEFTYIQQWITSEFPDNVFVLNAWEYSKRYVEYQQKSRIINITTNGSNELLFNSPSSLGHWEGIEVWVNGRNVYGKDCVVETGYLYTIDPNKTGTELNWVGSNSYLRPHTVNRQMKIIWKKNIPENNTPVEIRLSQYQWSNDWAHPINQNQVGTFLGRAMIYALMEGI